MAEIRGWRANILARLLSRHEPGLANSGKVLKTPRREKIAAHGRRVGNDARTVHRGDPVLELRTNQSRRLWESHDSGVSKRIS